MKHYNLAQIQSWDRFYRGNFINSLSGFKSASLIGTINKAGQTNLAIFSNIVHIGAAPPLIGFINRPIAATPHTIANIQATGQYTINNITKNIVAQAHQTSAKYDSNVSEFEAVGLTPIFKEGCIAPFVAESNLQYNLNLVEIIPITHNNTYLVIGAVQNVYVQNENIGADGFICLEKAGSIATLGIDGYYTCNQIARFEYAKPDEKTKKIYK